MIQDDWPERLPKVELHLHLEGAIPLDAFWQLVEKHGGALTFETETGEGTTFIIRLPIGQESRSAVPIQDRRLVGSSGGRA